MVKQTHPRSILHVVTGLILGVAVAVPATWLVTSNTLLNDVTIKTPFVEEYESKTKPLLQYSIPNLAKSSFEPSQIELIEKLDSNEDFSSYIFLYTSKRSEARISGQVNIPNGVTRFSNPSVLVMARGYVPPDIFETGVGTRNAAAYYASNGFITIAPDFLGFGESDDEFEDTWKGRFMKPVQVAELIETIRQVGIPITDTETPDGDIPVLKLDKIGLWGHSNGGQIILTTLEILGEPFPTTLWAPVTAPFPYSILFFGDELEDEGKSQRTWISLFEDEYDVFEFSLTQHLHLLADGTPLQIHHGTADDAALYAWSLEFVEKLEAENDRRAEASVSAEPVQFELFEYPGANHNLQPGWQTVVERDVRFFSTQLSEE